MSKFNSLKIKAVEKETADCVSVAFEVPTALKESYVFLPGQHLALKANINGVEVRRNYSICTSPRDKDLRVAIKKVEGGQFSTFANELLKPGDALEVMPPAGRFSPQLHSEQEKYYLAFAAGSGITPIISILKSVLEQEPKSNFTLFYGNSSSDSIIFKEQIEALKNQYLGRFRIFHILSQEHQGIDIFYGRITAEKCADFCTKLLDINDIDECFICGPEEMIHTVQGQLLSLGMKKERIHFELFTSPVGKLGNSQKKKKHSTKEVLSKITIIQDGNAINFDLTSTGDSILDAALKGGADLPFACKGGVCCTCKGKILEGKVEMDINYGLEQDEIEAGYVLTCQSHPRTKAVKVSFDE